MRSSDVRSKVEYGVQTPSSSTVAMVTDQIEEAEHMLDLIGAGRIMQRTVSYGPWSAVENSVPAAG
ncbi:MAG: hypothetical protein JWQ86_87 [Mycobacterium sp.]|jgi:hypothetical protein|nr:hypothetical protein [Mycobacterium sp.]MDT5216644.1 hypothetical protein [Mycobacterium sp.]MDT7757634.1 hypothetical protein [Mycobacterium sp.]